MTDGADAPVEGEPTDLPPPQPDPVDESAAPDEGAASTDIAESTASTESMESTEAESTEAAGSTEPVVTAVPPRRGPVTVQDRRRTLLGVATVVALAAASLFGFRLIGMLTDDEAGASSPSVDGPVGELVPFVVALTEPPSSPGAPDVLAALNTGRHDIAVDTDVAALCATVALDDELDLAGRWERNGELVASTASSELGEPGFADCVTADGEALPDGTYQFVVTDGDAVSSPGTVVLGAAAVAQRFVNGTDDAVCAIRLAPLRAGYFDVFDTSATPVEPGGSITLALADVRVRLEAVACDDGDVVSRALFRPDAAARTI